METVVQLVIAALAVYRASRMVAREDGPFNIFYRLRSRVRHWTRGRGDSWVWRGITCPLCISVWLAALAALALPWQGWAWYSLSTLAISGGATWLYGQEPDRWNQ